MSHDLNRRRAAYWDKQAGRYDRAMNFWDRHLFGDSRPWACGRAAGDVLEVAVGTGRNLSFYPDGARLTGVDWSPAMLGIARERAAALGRDADLRQGDAQALDFPDESFDTVLCALGLCAIPDDRRAVTDRGPRPHTGTRGARRPARSRPAAVHRPARSGAGAVAGQLLWQLHGAWNGSPTSVSLLTSARLLTAPTPQSMVVPPLWNPT